jgi:ketosteroid isomerase-like protein
MRIPRSLAVAVPIALLLGPPDPAAAGAPPALAPAEAEVWRVVQAFNRAFEANDADAFFGYLDDGIVLITPSNPYRIEGTVVDREEFEYGLRQGYGRVQFFQEVQPRIDVYGEVAVVTYYSRGSYGPADRAQTAYLKETDVLVRKKGEWKIVHIHLSATERRPS